MENTGGILFSDEESWYIAKGESYFGPFKSSEVFKRVVAGTNSPLDYIWREGFKEWRRICDVEIFAEALAVPQEAPSVEVIQKKAKEQQKKAPPPPRRSETLWFVYQNDTQTGPFAESELIRLIKTGQVASGVYVWNEEMSDWKTVGEIDSLASHLTKTPPPKKSKEKSDKRSAPRKPFIAKIILTDENTIISGVCRDISLGGMQILTDKMPGKTGTRVKVNVNPKDDVVTSGPFVAEGVVVRLLEDHRGFSFRFNKISDEIKKHIQKYIDS